MGSDAPTVRETVDADGFAVMPGFVDLHTHYDVQVTWDPTCFSSPSLGVTACVMKIAVSVSCRARPKSAIRS